MKRFERHRADEIVDTGEGPFATIEEAVRFAAAEVPEPNWCIGMADGYHILVPNPLRKASDTACLQGAAIRGAAEIALRELEALVQVGEWATNAMKWLDDDDQENFPQPIVEAHDAIRTWLRMISGAAESAASQVDLLRETVK